MMCCYPIDPPSHKIQTLQKKDTSHIHYYYSEQSEDGSNIKQRSNRWQTSLIKRNILHHAGLLLVQHHVPVGKSNEPDEYIHTCVLSLDCADWNMLG